MRVVVLESRHSQLIERAKRYAGGRGKFLREGMFPCFDHFARSGGIVCFFPTIVCSKSAMFSLLLPDSDLFGSPSSKTYKSGSTCVNATFTPLPPTTTFSSPPLPQPSPPSPSKNTVTGTQHQRYAHSPHSTFLDITMLTQRHWLYRHTNQHHLKNKERRVVAGVGGVHSSAILCFESEALFQYRSWP
ncbi:hypothetical protein BDW22DRAFT_859791 [Trametopsis cervina]|nr:hypothetical protein BDW22DRAFT_859791 [Trametopsis cervina]